MDLTKFGLKLNNDGTVRELCAGTFGDRDAYELSTVGLKWNKATGELEELVPGALSAVDIINASGVKHEIIDMDSIDFQKYGLKLGNDGKYHELCGGSYTQKDANELAVYGIRWNPETCSIERIIGKPIEKPKPKTAKPKPNA